VADFVLGATTSLSFAANATRALAAFGRVSAASAQTRDVPADFALERTGGGIGLNTADARTAVETSLLAGSSILDALRTLADAFRLATSAGLVGPSTSLTLDGTRISGVVITAQGQRLIDAIDSLVRNAAVSGANLIASNAGRVTIQTTQFGGRITVSPQPLDSLGLGIQGLSAVTPAEAEVSLARLTDAIALAGARVTNLEVLRDSLAPGNALTNELSRLLNTSSPGFLPRGTLVDQIA
jgi:hypothetical protein